MPGGPRGVVVTGPSGSGKSALALDLTTCWRDRGLYAALVADDRVVIRIADGAFIAEAPPQLAGLIERRGLGIARMDALPAACLHLHVALVERPERIQDDGSHEVAPGAILPSIQVPRLDGPHGARAAGIVRAVLAAQLRDRA